MEANTKKRIIIWTSVSAIVGVGGYFLYKYLKDKGIIGKKDTGSTGGQNTGGGAENQVVQPIASSTPTAEQTALATAYRIWANSTDELSKKYGKKSQYDLDATRSNPYGGTFLQSYAAGKAEYEASLKPSGTTVTSGNQNQVEQITSIAARYKAPIQAHTKGGQMVSLFFGAKFQGENKAYRVRVYEKNPYSGKKVDNGRLYWILFQANWSTFTSYENLSYTAISMGALKYEKGKFVGVNSWGVGVGANGNSNMITQFIQQVTNNQIYGVFDTSKLQ